MFKEFRNYVGQAAENQLGGSGLKSPRDNWKTQQIPPIAKAGKADRQTAQPSPEEFV